MNADERLRELIHGGPYVPYLWIVMVRLASLADDDGCVDPPEVALMSDWLAEPDGQHSKRALYCIRRLKADGWITVGIDGRWDIGTALRHGSSFPARPAQ